MPERPRRPPWCGPTEDPAAALARLLDAIRDTTTHAAAAERLGLSLRQWMRWWAQLVAIVPTDQLPPRTAGGTSERSALRAQRAAARLARVRGVK